MSTINTLQNIISEYNSYKNSLMNGQSSLNAVVQMGTILYSDPNMPSTFPSSWTAYQTYLASVGDAINTFINNFPVEPPLSG